MPSENEQIEALLLIIESLRQELAERGIVAPTETPRSRFKMPLRPARYDLAKLERRIAALEMIPAAAAN